MSDKSKIELFDVEAGLPIPGKRAGGPSKYPWLTMNIGDSFFVPYSRSIPPHVLQARVGSAANSAQRRHGRRFITRRVEGGVRGWRVAMDYAPESKIKWPADPRVREMPGAANG